MFLRCIIEFNELKQFRTNVGGFSCQQQKMSGSFPTLDQECCLLNAVKVFEKERTVLSDTRAGLVIRLGKHSDKAVSLVIVRENGSDALVTNVYMCVLIWTVLKTLTVRLCLIESYSPIYKKRSRTYRSMSVI